MQFAAVGPKVGTAARYAAKIVVELQCSPIAVSATPPTMTVLAFVQSRLVWSIDAAETKTTLFWFVADPVIHKSAIQRGSERFSSIRSMLLKREPFCPAILMPNPLYCAMMTLSMMFDRCPYEDGPFEPSKTTAPHHWVSPNEVTTTFRTRIMDRSSFGPETAAMPIPPLVPEPAKIIK